MGAMNSSTLSDRAAVSNEGIKTDEGKSGLNMMAARFTPGAISESSSSHLPPSEGSQKPKPVMFPFIRGPFSSQWVSPCCHQKHRKYRLFSGQARTTSAYKS